MLSLATSVIPLLAIGFVVVLLIKKIYVRIRSKFNATVNCWFCNQNTKVPYLESNSWTCPHCDQYNGFTKTGDYNREIFEQFNCSNLSGNKHDYSDQSADMFDANLPASNGLCNACNEAQRLKVEKLAQFEPKNETRFDQELKVYKAQLEEQYSLCGTCNHHLNQVLRNKKKMVLGSKFLNFIIKGAETLKQPHFNKLHHAQQQQWKQRFTLFITILSIINVCCLFSELPTFTQDNLVKLLGQTCGHQVFLALSHVVALWRVIMSYFETFGKQEIVLKFGLFFRTVFTLILYSLGLRLSQIVRISFVSCYVLASPFAILGLAFGYNFMDGFKLSRFTFLLALWSVLAGRLVGEQFFVSQNVLLFFASVGTFLISTTSNAQSSTKLHDISGNSFHRIYSEDYLSDEDTISMLSQQLNSSCSPSMRSMDTSRSYRTSIRSQYNRQAMSPRFTKSPLSSPSLSNNLSRTQLSPTYSTKISPNASFKSFCSNSNQTTRPQYASSMCGFPTGAMPSTTIFGSNPKLGNHKQYIQPPIFGRNVNNAAGNHSVANSMYSFQGPHAQPMRTPQESGLFTDKLNSFAGAATPLNSPFSVHSNAVYQVRPSNLLSPSHFSTNCLASNASATSWLSGGYFNQCQTVPHATTMSRSHCLNAHRNGMTAMDENLSRASSQSSGFESQNGPLNLSRENSVCPDASDLLQRTTLADNTKSFQPIDANCNAYFAQPYSSIISNTNYTQPLSVNCSMISPAPASEMWKAPAMRRTTSGRDSFNLHKINEDLPTLKRGDLLKKWKEGQTIS